MLTMVQPSSSNPITEAPAWNDLVAAAPGGHVLQTRQWGELKSAFGWHAESVRTASAAALVLFRPLPMRIGTLAYIPRGPAVDWNDPGALLLLRDALDGACRRHRAVLLKVEPWLEDTPAHCSALERAGFRPSPHSVQARRTILVELAGSEDEVLARMKPKCRYNVRLAQKKGVRVRPAAREDLPAFHALMAATSARDGFAVHSPAYYEEAYRLFVERADLATLLLAEVPGSAAPVAALFATAFASLGIYLYGASADEGRQLMPTYLLQWEAMRWARAHGCAQYDLLGVPDEDEAALEAQFEARHDGLWGVYRFKRGWGGRLFRSVGAWDRVYNPALYWAYLRVVARRATAAV